MFNNNINYVIGVHLEKKILINLGTPLNDFSLIYVASLLLL